MQSQQLIIILTIKIRIYWHLRSIKNLKSLHLRKIVKLQNWKRLSRRKFPKYNRKNSSHIMTSSSNSNSSLCSCNSCSKIYKISSWPSIKTNPSNNTTTCVSTQKKLPNFNKKYNNSMSYCIIISTTNVTSNNSNLQSSNFPSRCLNSKS